MCSLAHPSFEAPAQAFWSSLDPLFARAARTADNPAQWNEADSAGDEFSEGIMTESSLHGTIYRLVRTPGAHSLPLVAPYPESQHQSEMFSDVEEERRTNIGSFQRVLVAEAHPATRLMLVQMLRRWGFEAVSAEDANEVLRIAKQRRAPQLVILSRRLPGIDAVELCRQICNLHSDYAPYVLMLAMENQRRDIMHALESGAAEYITTPFEARELRARLIVATRILKRQESLIASRDRFRLLATKDTLTGVWNRRSIYQILKDELECAALSERSTGVLLIDLDYFKRVNDTHGHLAGDFVLQEVSRRLKKALRTYDAIGRYGGEEFLIVVPGSNEDELSELAERLRKAIEKDPVSVKHDEIQITLSIGAAIAAPRKTSLANAIAVADAALYDAKRFGRNRVAFGDPHPGRTTGSRSHNRFWPASALPESK